MLCPGQKENRLAEAYTESERKRYLSLIEAVLKAVSEDDEVSSSDLNRLLQLLTRSDDLSPQQRLVEWLKHEI